MTSSPAARLLRWYARHARRLPWRDHPGRRRRGTYSIWVSEIMLQQTRAATVIPYYRRWMRRFPSLRALAAAQRAEVLGAWEGLGYYRRAHHLHRAARMIVNQRGGRMPRTAEELRSLPGIGRYTAAAIASIAFGADVIALDGNVRRVLARFFDLRGRGRTNGHDAGLLQRAQEILPRGRAGDFNQALMDLGAGTCTPRNPDCVACPLSASCLANRRGTQERERFPPRRHDLPRRLRIAAVVRRSGRVLLVRRPEGGLLGGLWEFPSAGSRRRSTTDGAISVRVGRRLGAYRQAYSHFESLVRACEARLDPGGLAGIPQRDRRWVALSRLDRYPMGRVDRRIAQDLQKGRAANRRP
ncbi:MAG TPA: A/G-specific adenine glycosylase [Anaerolineales bacterium]